jgi:phosphopantetheinyl transferase (holo-ACP synthase)
MIGNDIVDISLALTDSNWQRKGFLNKIFCESEQNIIKNSGYSAKMVWLLWSMKESAYKIYTKQCAIRFFGPSKFQCNLTSENEGVVEINDYKYVTKSQLNKNYIHTIATLKKDKKIISNCFKIGKSLYASQHYESYKSLKMLISVQCNLPIQELRIIKNKIGIPKLYHNKVQLKTDFSISHHGNYGAYSILN